MPTLFSRQMGQYAYAVIFGRDHGIKYDDIEETWHRIEPIGNYHTLADDRNPMSQEAEMVLFYEADGYLTSRQEIITTDSKAKGNLEVSLGRDDGY